MHDPQQSAAGKKEPKGTANTFLGLRKGDAGYGHINGKRKYSGSV